VQSDGEAEQEGGQPLLGGALAQEGHQAGVVTDLAAEQPEHLVLQVGDGGGEFLQLVEGDLADGGGLERLGGTDVLAQLDAVEADHLAR